VAAMMRRGNDTISMHAKMYSYPARILARC
jgi:hypothetical protein